MAQVSFTKRELNRGKVVEPAWYRCKIETVGEAPAKASEKGPSTNYPVEATILFNGDTGDTTFKEIPLDWNFNSKAMGFAVGFLQAFGVEVKEGVRYDLKSAEGREIDIFVDNDVYNNRPINKVNHKYRPIRSDVTPVAAVAIG